MHKQFIEIKELRKTDTKARLEAAMIKINLPD